MKRSISILLILLCAPLVSFAQSVWQGSCAVGSYSSFPSTGLYGASNSFAQNTLVTVENAQTNQKATVMIIDRLDNNGLFMLLSRDAGKAIGLSPGEVGQVTVTLAKRAGTITRGPGDLPYSTDPDIFPAAAAGNANSLSFLDKYLKSAAGGAGAPQPPAQAPSATAPKLTAEAGKQAAQPSVSSLSPQSTPKAAAEAQTAKPPAPQLAQATGPSPAPTTQPQAAQKAPPSSTTGAPAAPTGPVVTELKSRTPSPPVQPEPTVLAAPPVPEKAGGAPVVSELRRAVPPAAAPQVVFSGTPALPEIRNPGPSVSAVAQAAPPASQLPELSMALPSAPTRLTKGPQVSELAQASPSVAPFAASVTEVPAVPAPQTAVAATTTGPMVSALAAARTPSSALEIAQAQLPLPSLEGFTPQVSTLASTEPPASSAAKPPTTAPSVPSQPLQEAQVSQPPAAKQPAPAVAEAAPSRPLPVGAGTVHMVGRIPVRPSTALAPSSYYVQLGVYVDSNAAVALADNLSPDYPVSVYAFQQAKRPLYKVMIGPLNSDESGTLLYLFIAQGYKDAFVRRGE